MNLSKLHKGLALTAVMAIAIGGAVALSSGGSGISGLDAVHDADVPESGASDGTGGSVMTQIDQALGRTSPESAALNKNGTLIQPQSAPAPASRDAGGATSAASAPPAAPGTNGRPLTSTADRKIVQTASIRLQVKEVGGSFEEVGRIATGAGGFMASSNFSYQGDQQVASLTIRVPSARYQEVMGQLRGLGAKVDSESSNASDVTEEYTDLNARLRNLEATETSLLGFLSQARTVSEVLQVQDRLNNVRSEIERVKGRMSLLDKLTDLSTITVHLRPVVAGSGTNNGGSGLGAEITEAWEDSLDFLGGIATDAITAIVFVWWVPLLAIPGSILWLRFGRRSEHAQAIAHD